MIHVTPVPAQQTRLAKYTVKQYTDANGLPQNSIKSISSDSEGFIWLATEDGLTRFDGRQFYNFNKSSLSVSSNRFFLIQPSMAGELPDYHGSTDSQVNKRLYAIADGYEYVRIEKGHARRDSNYFIQKIAPVLFDKGSGLTYLHSRLPDYLLAQDRPKRLFLPVGRGNGNFFLLENASVSYYSDSRKVYSTNFTRDHGWNFFTANGGLFYFDARGEVLQLNDQKISSFSLAGDMLVDPAYQVGGRGIEVYWNSASDQVFFYLGRNLYTIERIGNGSVYTRLLIEDFDLAIRNIQSIHFDKKSGTVFLGSLTQGLFVVSKKSFKNLTTSGDEMENVFYAQIPFDDQFVLTPTGVLIGKVNDKDETIFKRLPGFDKFNQDDKRSLLRDRNGLIWIKAGSTLIQMDARAEQVVNQWFLGDEIKHVFQGRGNVIWIGLGNKGLYTIDPSVSDPKPKLFLDHLKITYLEDGPKGQLLLGATNGCYTLDVATKKLRLVEETDGIYIKNIYQSRTGQIWLTALENGVMLYERGRVVKFPMDRNRYLSSAHCIIEDKYGFLWIPTNKGLFKARKTDLMHYARLELEGIKVGGSGVRNPGTFPEIFYQYYDRDDGFATNEFNGGCQPCALELANGHISLPSLKGFIWFKPDQIQSLAPDGPIIADRMEHSNGSVSDFGDTIRVPLNAKNIKIYFSTPYYGNAHNLHLSYALVEGQGNVNFAEWIPLTSQDLSVSIPGLSSGDYELFVRKINGFGSKNYTIKKIYIQVPMVWYETWWARSLLILLILAGIYAYYRIRLYRMESQNRLLEQVMARRTGKLKQALSDLENSKGEISRQLQMMSRLLTSMTHDIQSPLNYIAITSGGIPNLIRQGELGEVAEIGRLISNSSHQMSSLLKDLLDYIKANLHSASLRFGTVDVNALVHNKLEIFQTVIESKNNQIVNQLPESLTVHSDLQMLAIIIHNLIDNAAKFTSNGCISFTSREDQENTYLVISNNGAPISKTLQEVFNQDVNTSDKTPAPGRSSGLGFLIVKEIAELIHVGLTVTQTETTNFQLVFKKHL